MYETFENLTNEYGIFTHEIQTKLKAHSILNCMTDGGG